MDLGVSIRANDEQHVWIKELDRGPLAKLTFAGSLNNGPAWTPDGRSVAFVSNRGDDRDLYVRRADGTGQAELLWDDEGPIGEVTYSPDGEWLVYRVNAENPDLYALRVGVDSVPVPLVATEFSDAAPAVSPDGRWLAYASDESGRNLFDIYVRPFPPNTNDGKWLVSTNGGIEPVWAHSGRELFYRDLNNLVVVEVLQGPSFVAGERRVLFSSQGFRTNPLHQFYDVTSDDRRFVMIRNPSALSANVRETRSTQRIRVGRRQRKRTCWDCEREWKRMVVPLEPGRPSEARQLLRTQR